MAIRKVQTEPVKYVPAYGGNREDPDPLWVMITPLDREQADKYAKSTRFAKKKGFRDEWESNAISVQKKQFINNVKEVHRFLDESDTEITDILDFYNTAPQDLIEEIISCLLDNSQIEDIERKN